MSDNEFKRISSNLNKYLEDLDLDTEADKKEE
jgi:hypothetical protein